MAPLCDAHCHLNPESPVPTTGASYPVPNSFYYVYYYAYQAMLEVRSSSE
jgi:hypothetical protein